MPASCPKKVRKALAVGLVNLAVLLGLLELAGLIYLSTRDGTLFYTRAWPQEPPPAAQSAEETATNNVLHPVLGFIRPPQLPLAGIASRERLDRMVGSGITPDWYSIKANNFGFFAVEDYPYALVQENEEYLIGVFGGSVAQWFALQGAERLAARLQEDAFLQHRNLRILNLAQGGFKQPQQLHTLAYFLALGQHFDFVINVDGFNEVALSYLNATRNIDTSLPSAQHLLPIISLLDGASIATEYLDALTALKKDRHRAADVAGMMERNPSAAVQVLLERLHRAAQTSYWDSVQKIDALSADTERTVALVRSRVHTLGAWA